MSVQSNSKAYLVQKLASGLSASFYSFSKTFSKYLTQTIKGLVQFHLQTVKNVIRFKVKLKITISHHETYMVQMQMVYE